MAGLRSRVRVLSIRASRIPGVEIVELEGDDVSVTMDIHKELLVFREGDELDMVVSKDLPSYKDGKDFCARGIVVSIKDGGDSARVVISLWGYLVIIRPRDRSIINGLGLKPSDEIYYCLLK